MNTFKDKQYSFEAIVVTGPHVNNLFGRDAASAMGLVKRLEKLQPISFFWTGTSKDKKKH